MNQETAACQKARLLRRGARAGKPLATGDQVELERELGAPAAASTLAFYRLCNGFDDLPGGLYIELWDLGTISRRRREDYGKPFIGRAAPIGDILIGSDFFVCDLTDEHSAVSLLFEDRILCHSFDEFIDDLLANKFDWASLV